MKEIILNKFENLKSFAKGYFRNSETFDTEEHYYYSGGSEIEIVIRKSGKLFGRRHRVAIINCKEVDLKDPAYGEEVIEMIRKYEKLTKERVTLIRHIDKMKND